MFRINIAFIFSHVDNKNTKIGNKLLYQIQLKLLSILFGYGIYLFCLFLKLQCQKSLKYKKNVNIEEKSLQQIK